MISSLATVRQLRDKPELIERDREAAGAAASGFREAKAENTRRAYGSACAVSRNGPRPVVTGYCPPPCRL